MTFTEIARRRKNAGKLWTGSGVGFASDYVKTLIEAAGSPDRLSRYLIANDLSQLDKSLKDAAEKLVYRNGDMDVTAGHLPTRTFGIPLRKDLSAPPRSLMTLEYCASSSRKDRDGDVLLPKGAQIDPRMPLLWQHVPDMPIGPFVAELSRDENKIMLASAIAETKLGEDAAILVEAGALRISHGFNPIEFEPNDPTKEDDGWLIRAWEMMETSLVSIPSNVDAIITSFSRAKLHHPVVKLHAGYLSDSRPATVKGGWEAPTINVTVNMTDVLATKGRKSEPSDTYNLLESGKISRSEAIDRLIANGLDRQEAEAALAGKSKKDDAPEWSTPQDVIRLWLNGDYGDSAAISALANLGISRRQAVSMLAQAAGISESEFEKASNPTRKDDAPPPLTPDATPPEPEPEVTDTTEILKEIADRLKALGKIKEMPKEAANRVATVAGMLEDIQASMDERTADLTAAADAADLGAIMEHVQGLVDDVVAKLQRVDSELMNLKEIEGMPDEAFSIITEIDSSIGKILDNLSKVTGTPSEPDADDTPGADGTAPDVSADDEPDDQTSADCPNCKGLGMVPSADGQMENCSMCGGLGYKGDQQVTCGACHGEGAREDSQGNVSTCNVCGGQGWYYGGKSSGGSETESAPCQYCNGTGIADGSSWQPAGETCAECEGMGVELEKDAVYDDGQGVNDATPSNTATSHEPDDSKLPVGMEPYPAYVCPKCGTANNPGDLQCKRCSTPLIGNERAGEGECQACGGTGVNWDADPNGSDLDCPACGGTGKAEKDAVCDDGQGVNDSSAGSEPGSISQGIGKDASPPEVPADQCPKCGGSGKSSTGEICSECGGDGLKDAVYDDGQGVNDATAGEEPSTISQGVGGKGKKGVFTCPQCRHGIDASNTDSLGYGGGGDAIGTCPYCGYAIPIDDWVEAASGYRATKPGKAANVPDIRQEFAFDCGAAATLSVTKYYGVGPASELDLITLLGTTEKDGTPPERIANYLQSLGLKVSAQNGMEIADLKAATDQGWPVIACIQDYEASPSDVELEKAGHYVVVTDVNDGMSEGLVWIQDPSAGKMSIPANVFLSRWQDRDTQHDHVHFGIVVGGSGKSRKDAPAHEGNDICLHCVGTGKDDDWISPCPICGGTGTKDAVADDGNDIVPGVATERGAGLEDCQVCHGDGVLNDGGECWHCLGTGKVQATQGYADSDNPGPKGVQDCTVCKSSGVCPVCEGKKKTGEKCWYCEGSCKCAECEGAGLILKDDSEAFHTGFEAHQQGEPRTANPYPKLTYDSDEWFSGWDEADS